MVDRDADSMEMPVSLCVCVCVCTSICLPVSLSLSGVFAYSKNCERMVPLSGCKVGQERGDGGEVVVVVEEEFSKQTR